MEGRRKVFHLLFGLTLALGMMLAMSLVAFAADATAFAGASLASAMESASGKCLTI